jgi:hypothetical protein
MQERLNERLDTLRREYEAGQKMLADLEARQLELRETLLRIAGAIQVVQELLADTGTDADAAETDRTDPAPHAVPAPGRRPA